MRERRGSGGPGATAGIRLSPFITVIPVASGVHIRSDLKSFALAGEGVADLVRRLLPLVDGRHSASAIVAALPEYSAESVRSLLAELGRLGVVEVGGDETGGPVQDSAGLTGFLGLWGKDSVEMRATIGSARVAILGLTEWARVAAEALTRSGVGHLLLLETGGKRRAAAGDESSAELVRRLNAIGSPTVVARGAACIREGRLRLPPGEVSLLLATPPRDDLALLIALARTAHERQIRYLVAHLDGLSALLGPVVNPGETACWECLRVRRLANQTDPAESALLDAALLAAAPPARRPMLPPGSASVLGGLIGLEALKLLSGYAPCQLVGRQLELNLVTHAAKVHGVVRLPWCRLCGGAAAGPPASAGPERDLAALPDPADLREALAGWVDERTGLVRHLAINQPSPEQPQSVTTTTAVIPGYAVPGQRADDPVIGSGKGIDAVGAMVGAVGEAIERYSASHYRESDLVRASARKLGRRGFDPAALALYLPEQYREPGFPYDEFDAAKEISWAEARWLDTGKPVLVPALPTFFNYHAPRGERFCQVTSSGLAAGSSDEDAAVRATMELIERDGFMTTWLLRRPPVRIAPGPELGEPIVDLLAEMTDLGMRTELFLLQGEVAVPSVMCIAWGDGRRRPAAAVALAAHVDPIEAVRKAVLEQAHVGPYVARLMADPVQRVPRRAADVRSLNDHALFYVPRRRLASFDFIRASRTKPIAVGKLRPAAGTPREACVAALAAAGLRVAVADVTSPDVRLGPFRVTRALGTYLQPIDFGYRNRRLANPRLYRNGHSLNPDPHPLA